MARKGKRTVSSGNEQVTDFRHEEATRKNNPPAGIAPTYEARERQATQHGRAAFPCGEDVVTWFLDTEYAGKIFKIFRISQAFFPGDDDALENLQHALKAQIDSESFEKMLGTVSFPFQPDKHRRNIAKMIDFQGNEVVR